MSQISSTTTGAVSIGAASLIPVVTWLLYGCSGPMPEDLPYLITGAIITGAHWATNYFNAKSASQTPAPPVPQQSTEGATA